MSTAPLENGDGPADPPAHLRQALLATAESVSIRDTVNVLLQDHVRRGRRGLAICAPSSGAGVTFVTTVLAVALARVGVRVLVVEANLRRPGLAALVPPSMPHEPGLLSFLLGEVDDPTRIINPDAMPNLSAVYAGGKRAEAADLFDTDRFEQVMAHALRTYDLTLIDTPASNRYAEARRIAAVAGYAALVARRNHTMSEDMGQLVKDLRLDRTEVIGSIFNEG